MHKNPTLFVIDSAIPRCEGSAQAPVVFGNARATSEGRTAKVEGGQAGVHCQIPEVPEWEFWIISLLAIDSRPIADMTLKRG